MLVGPGGLEQGFRPTAPVADAVAGARADGGVAWVTLREPGAGEVEAILDALGVDRRVLLVADRVPGHAGVEAAATSQVQRGPVRGMGSGLLQVVPAAIHAPQALQRLSRSVPVGTFWPRGPWSHSHRISGVRWCPGSRETCTRMMVP